MEQAGGRAVVVPGMGADMRLGDVMQQEKADLGISVAVVVQSVNGRY